MGTEGELRRGEHVWLSKTEPELILKLNFQSLNPAVTKNFMLHL